MKDSTVWIIVPVYNAMKTLKKCVCSLIEQSYTDIQIILIDDGSTDESGKLCDNFATQDDRITVVHTENCGSLGARRNGILQIPDTGYTMFCDSDDFLPSDAVEKLYRLITDNNADVSCGICQRVFLNGIKFKKLNIPDSLKAYRVYEKSDINSLIMRSYFGITDFPGYMHTKMYKNHLIKESLDFECPVKFFQEDIAFNIQILYKTERIAVSPEIVYFYRMGGGTSKFMPHFLEDCINLYEFKLRQIENKSFPESFAYTSAVEMKNELFTWFEMFFRKHRNNLPAVKAEIERCCQLEPIVKAVNYPKEDSSGILGFREMVKNKKTQDILELLILQEKKNKLKNLVKKIFF